MRRHSSYWLCPHSIITLKWKIQEGGRIRTIVVIKPLEKVNSLTQSPINWMNLVDQIKCMGQRLPPLLSIDGWHMFLNINLFIYQIMIHNLLHTKHIVCKRFLDSQGLFHVFLWNFIHCLSCFLHFPDVISLIVKASFLAFIHFFFFWKIIYVLCISRPIRLVKNWPSFNLTWRDKIQRTHNLIQVFVSKM